MSYAKTAILRTLGMAGLSVCLLSQPLTAEEEDPLKPYCLLPLNSPDVGWYVQNDNVMGGQRRGV